MTYSAHEIDPYPLPHLRHRYHEHRCKAITIQLIPPAYSDTIQFIPPAYTNTIQFIPLAYTHTIQFIPLAHTHTIQFIPPAYTNTIQLIPPAYTNMHTSPHRYVLAGISSIPNASVMISLPSSCLSPLFPPSPPGYWLCCLSAHETTTVHCYRRTPTNLTLPHSHADRPLLHSHSPPSLLPACASSSTTAPPTAIYSVPTGTGESDCVTSSLAFNRSLTRLML